MDFYRHAGRGVELLITNEGVGNVEAGRRLSFIGTTKLCAWHEVESAARFNISHLVVAGQISIDSIKGGIYGIAEAGSFFVCKKLFEQFSIRFGGPESTMSAILRGTCDSN